MAGSHTDITERKQAEEALRQRNQYIETILEKSPIGFAAYTIDDGVVRFVSARFEEIYRVPRGTITSYDNFFQEVWAHDPVFREQLSARRVTWPRTIPALAIRGIPVASRRERPGITAVGIPIASRT
jgi:PAS domain-containing protein